MRQAHQGVPFRSRETHPASRRLCYGLGLALAISSWTSQEAWAVTASPTTMTFQAVQGTPNPASQTLNVSKANSREKQWAASTSANWLTLSPAGGIFTSTTQVAVAVNSAGLAPGTYTATVSIKINNGGKVSVPVTLKLLSATTTTTPTTSTIRSPTTAILTWSANTDTDLGGYRVYLGTASGVYGAPIDVGKVTSYVVSNLQLGNTYYFTVTAYDVSNNESVHSAEVTKSCY